MRSSQCLLLKAGETRSASPLKIFSDVVFVKLGGGDTDGNYAIMETLTPPLLEGEYAFEVDGKEIVAGPGCSIFAARGTAHTFQNIGNGPGRMLVIVQPAGLDAFFVDLDSATRGMREPDLSVVVPIFSKHGLELLGPPLGARAKRIAAGI